MLSVPPHPHPHPWTCALVPQKRHERARHLPPAPSPGARLRGELGRFFRGRAAGDPAYAPPRVEGGPRRLTEQELAHLYHHGYVIVPGVVARHQAEAALRSINRSLGATGRVGGEQGECCKELKNAPEVLDLYRASAVATICKHLLGPTYPVGGAQIALRFPGDGCGPNFQVGPHWARHWHIDGLAAANNPSTPVGQIHNFNALVGIVLQVGEKKNRTQGSSRGTDAASPPGH